MNMNLASLTDTIAFSPLRLALLIFGASCIVLGFALVSQYGFGLHPCELCYWQRWPYRIVIGISLLAAVIAGFRPRMSYALLASCALVFLAGAGIAGFHVGVEYKWWDGLAACSQNAIPKNATLEELRAIVSRLPVTPCDAPAATFMGLSMAAYNFMASLVLAGASFYLVRKGMKRNGS